MGNYNKRPQRLVYNDNSIVARSEESAISPFDDPMRTCETDSFDNEATYSIGAFLIKELIDKKTQSQLEKIAREESP